MELQDEGFENSMMDAMITHIIQRYDEMLLEEFLAVFLQITSIGSTGRKLVVDWLVWSMVASDVTPEKIPQQIHDPDFCCDVVKGLLRKKDKEWESESMPPYLASKYFCHTHVYSSKVACIAGAKAESRVEKAMT